MARKRNGRNNDKPDSFCDWTAYRPMGGGVLQFSVDCFVVVVGVVVLGATSDEK